jgi:hypothetical protein
MAAVDEQACAVERAALAVDDRLRLTGTARCPHQESRCVLGKVAADGCGGRVAERPDAALRGQFIIGDDRGQPAGCRNRRKALGRVGVVEQHGRSRRENASKL